MDREAVRSVVMRITHHIDRKQWSALRSLYADVVDTDYTSLSGGQPQKQRGDDLIAGWRAALGPVSTQHLLGPIDVDLAGDGLSATAECHVRAWHHAKGVPGGDEWVVGGHYVIRLARTGDRWAITAMTLQTFQQSGNLQLLQQAAASAASR
jgi:hypothetical protein